MFLAVLYNLQIRKKICYKIKLCTLDFIHKRSENRSHQGQHHLVVGALGYNLAEIFLPGVTESLSIADI